VGSAAHGGRRRCADVNYNFLRLQRCNFPHHSPAVFVFVPSAPIGEENGNDRPMVYDVTATGVLWATLVCTWGLCFYQVQQIVRVCCITAPVCQQSVEVDTQKPKGGGAALDLIPGIPAQAFRERRWCACNLLDCSQQPTQFQVGSGNLKLHHFTCVCQAHATRTLIPEEFKALLRFVHCCACAAPLFTTTHNGCGEWGDKGIPSWTALSYHQYIPPGLCLLKSSEVVDLLLRFTCLVQVFPCAPGHGHS